MMYTLHRFLQAIVCSLAMLVLIGLVRLVSWFL